MFRLVPVQTISPVCGVADHHDLMTTTATPSIRTNAANPNHHLWNNHGTWWLHYTLHEGLTKRRVRRSLETDCVALARSRRDAALTNSGALAA